MLTRMSVATLAILTAPAASSMLHAADIETGGCTASYHSFSCTTVWSRAQDPNVRIVPTASTKLEEEASAARDRQWLARCHPAIRQDRYGVSRYHYAAHGCEFGVIGANLH